MEGQIYLPQVNWALCLLGIAAVAGFRNTTQIGYAFSESRAHSPTSQLVLSA